MSVWIPSELRRRLRERFARLYGDESAPACKERLLAAIGRYGVGAGTLPRETTRWSERDAVLIAYGDSIRAADEPPLTTLKTFADEHLQEAFSTLHILPFYPYSSDDGFSVIDYRAVNPELGDWDDVRALGERFDLMFDLVLNHASRKSAWFRSYREGDAPYRSYFIEADPAADLSAVVRPRSLPLLTRVQRADGPAWVWTTFSDDQMDLDFRNPDVLFEFIDILFGYIANGARIIRLDAVAYVWKQIGTPCIHLPETHEVVKLLREIVEMVAPEVLLLTETNVPHEENISYFGASDEAHMVYQFSLPPLLLHALQTGDARHLLAWLRGLAAPPPGCTWFNFTASHDGIGVRPLQGLLPDAEINALIERIRARGGQVSTRRAEDGRDVPYELNITYFDALSDGRDFMLDTARFLCSQTVPMSLQGMPAVYIQSLFGARNDEAGYRATGRARSLNRKKWVRAELDSLLSDPTGRERIIFDELRRRLATRASLAAFHPDAPQTVEPAPDGVLAIRRTPAAGRAVDALHNLTDRAIDVRGFAGRRDALAGAPFDGHLAPYQCCWLLDA